MQSLEKKDSFSPIQPKGQFSPDGIALDKIARSEAIERYQSAINSTFSELHSLESQYPDITFSIFLVGSINELSTFRFGIHDVKYATHAQISDRKLAQSTYAARQNNLPSDLDFIIKLTGNIPQDRSFYSTIKAAFEEIEERIFRQTGVLVELDFKNYGSYKTTPISALRGSSFKNALYR